MNQKIKRDPNRPLDFLVLPLSLGLRLHKHKSADIADALKMAFYCARELNGGVIAGAAGWSARKWLASAGVRRKIEHECLDLWHFSNGDLICEIYDKDRETHVLSIRKTNSGNARKRWDDGSDRLSEGEGEGEGDEEEEEENSVVVVDAATDRRGDHPDNFEELFDFLKKKYPNIPNEQLNDCAHAFMDAGGESEWRDSAGEPIHSWKGAVMGFAEKRLRRCSKSRGSGGGNARSMAEAEERERRRAELREELEGAWPADSQQS